MLSKSGTGKKAVEDSSNGKLLNEIEAISKALYLDKIPSRSLVSGANVRSKSTGKNLLPDPKSKLKHGDADVSNKDKKSIWNWRPLKALSHIRNRRFNCCFSLQVHSIEKLPSSFNDISLCVHWRRRDGEMVTRPAKAFQGIAELEEKLTYTCSVYGSRSGPHHSAKYEAKHFLLYAAVFGAPELDLGQHRVDLTRLLPLTLEELEEEKSSGMWSTSYKLSGKAKGATMNVSFGYLVVSDNPNRNVPEVLNLKQKNQNTSKSVTKFGQGDGRSSIRRADSLPSFSNQQSHATSQSVEKIKDLHEVLPTSKSELPNSVTVLYQEDKFDVSVHYKPEHDMFTEQPEPIIPDLYLLSDSGKENVANECEGNEFSIVEQGVELSSKEHEKLEEATVVTKDAADVVPVESPEVVEIDTGVLVAYEEGAGLHTQVEQHGSEGNELAAHDHSFIDTKESLMEELESALTSVSNLEIAAIEFPEDQENHFEMKSNYKTYRKGMSHSLDITNESVASEFLNMLGIEHSPFALSSESDPESPRERLLRQFEKDTLAAGGSLFDFDMGVEEHDECGYNALTESRWGDLSDDFELSSIIQAAEEEHQMATQEEKGKMRAKMLEDLETESLMREWGLNEKAFECSPPMGCSGFGSPIDLPEEPLELPPLGEGLGSFIQTDNGGFLRSMNPSLFEKAKSGGSLIMQVSSPIVVPAEMGSGIMEILQRLASVGIEKLSMQANKLMPLEDVTGKTMQQIAWEAAPALEGLERQCLSQHESEGGHSASGVRNRVKRSSGPWPNSSSMHSEMGSEYVSLEDLAPLAMDKIEALSIEGLRIQSGMSDDDAPSNINTESIREKSNLHGRGINMTGSLGLEGAAGLQLMDIKDTGDDVDGIMGLSLTLDEWMRLDSGEIADEDQISERTSKILAAHHASSLDMIRRGSKGERRRGKGSSRKCGLLGNNFTVALMVQLRDPLRDYDAVGAPMLALIQVERVFLPPKPKIYSTVPDIRNRKEDDDNESESVLSDIKEEKILEQVSIPQFKITEVHVAGLKTEPGRKKLWGSTSQQQSGSRWLVANGMGKSNKHPFMKSKAVSKSSAPVTTQAVSKSPAPVTTKVQPGETLWSVSSHVQGIGAKWKELTKMNPHVRNPNIILPK